jgi:hypothetical protein
MNRSIQWYRSILTVAAFLSDIPIGVAVALCLVSFASILIHLGMRFSALACVGLD